MAKVNIPEELEALLQEYLTDGIISAKERQVLLKKAVALGVDADEFDLYIDAQQQKADQAVDAAVSKKRGKTCPYCGGSVPQLTDKCPHCNQTITPEASEELKEILEHLEDALVELKSGKDIAKSKANVERYVRKAKMYYENNPKIQKLLTEIEKESVKADQTAKLNARKNAISNIITNKIFLPVLLILVGAYIVFFSGDGWSPIGWYLDGYGITDDLILGILLILVGFVWLVHVKIGLRGLFDRFSNWLKEQK